MAKVVLFTLFFFLSLLITSTNSYAGRPACALEGSGHGGSAAQVLEECNQYYQNMRQSGSRAGSTAGSKQATSFSGFGSAQSTKRQADPKSAGGAPRPDSIGALPPPSANEDPHQDQNLELPIPDPFEMDDENNSALQPPNLEDDPMINIEGTEIGDIGNWGGVMSVGHRPDNKHKHGGQDVTFHFGSIGGVDE
jgi:hypothetical protein